MICSGGKRVHRQRHVAHGCGVHLPKEGGLVMILFNLPSLNAVFRVIRDAFGPTKETLRSTVMEKCMVFLHDRAGSLADAQEFELHEFRRKCFEPDLLEVDFRQRTQEWQKEGEVIDFFPDPAERWLGAGVGWGRART
jgi:isocitrate dehydrogenase kinase/phosphatase